MRRLILAACAALLSFSAFADSTGGQTGDGMFYPALGGPVGWNTNQLAGSAQVDTLDASGEKYGVMGQWVVNGGGTNKTCSTGGSVCKIRWFTGTVSNFASADDTLDVGLQNVSTTTGPPMQPDEVYTVSGRLIGGTDTISSNTLQTTAMESGSLTSIDTGDFVAIAWEIATTGTVSVTVRKAGSGSNLGWHWPLNALKTGGSWASSVGQAMAVVTFDDGTLGWIYGTAPVLAATTAKVDFNTGSANDERALICQLPFDAFVEGLGGFIAQTDGGDASLKLYSDPLGTPTLMTGSAGGNAQIDLDADQTNASNSARGFQLLFPAATGPVFVKGNTPFAVSLLATTATSVSTIEQQVAAAADMDVYQGGQNCYLGIRDGSTGAFTATTTTRPFLGVIIRNVVAAGCRVNYRGGTCY